MALGGGWGEGRRGGGWGEAGEWGGVWVVVAWGADRGVRGWGQGGWGRDSAQARGKDGYITLATSAPAVTLATLSPGLTLAESPSYSPRRVVHHMWTLISME